MNRKLLTLMVGICFASFGLVIGKSCAKRATSSKRGGLAAPPGAASVEVPTPTTPEPERIEPPKLAERVLERHIKKGETVILTQTLENRMVRNETPVKDEDVEVSLGASCDAREDGRLTVVGSDGSDILVRYRKAKKSAAARKSRKDAEDEDEEAGHVACPSGTLFFIDRSDYLDKTEASRAETVKRLLEEEAPPKKNAK